MSNQKRTINFPSINWEELKRGALSKDKVWEEIQKCVKQLLDIQMLKRTNFLSKNSIEKAREIEQKLDELKQNYPQIRNVVQNILGREIKEIAIQKGESRSLFERLSVTTQEAVFHGSLQEWSEERLKEVPVGLKRSFLVRIRDGKNYRYFLPANWRNNVHKRTALVLRDLAEKATRTWKEENGIPLVANPDPAKSKPVKPQKLTPKKSVAKEKSVPIPTPKPEKPKAKKTKSCKTSTAQPQPERNKASASKRVATQKNKRAEAEKEIRTAETEIEKTEKIIASSINSPKKESSMHTSPPLTQKIDLSSLLTKDN